MLTRRQILTRTLKGSSLLALGTVVPQFVVNTARAAETGKDTILVVLEMTGGNDGLNTVIPYADDLYHKARPTLRLTKDQVVKLNDHIGLNPAMRGFDQLLAKAAAGRRAGRRLSQPRPLALRVDGHLAVGRPRRETVRHRLAGPQRHGLAGPARQRAGHADRPGEAAAGPAGSPSGVVSINNQQPFKLNMGGGSRRSSTRHASSSCSDLARTAGGQRQPAPVRAAAAAADLRQPRACCRTCCEELHAPIGRVPQHAARRRSWSWSPA